VAQKVSDSNTDFDSIFSAVSPIVAVPPTSIIIINFHLPDGLVAPVPQGRVFLFDQHQCHTFGTPAPAASALQSGLTIP
jgi:hypothetical protein